MTLPADSLTDAERMQCDHIYRDCDRWDEAIKDAYFAGKRAARASTIEECARICDKIDAEAVGWIRRHPDETGDAYKHTDGVSDGADACAEAIRNLARADPPIGG